MGKASQAKKVAREARERGEVPARPKRRLGYPIVLAVAVLLGVFAVWYAARPADTPTSKIVTPEVQTTDSSVVDPTATTVAADAVPTSTTVAP